MKKWVMPIIFSGLLLTFTTLSIIAVVAEYRVHWGDGASEGTDNTTLSKVGPPFLEGRLAGSFRRESLLNGLQNRPDHPATVTSAPVEGAPLTPSPGTLTRE